MQTYLLYRGVKPNGDKEVMAICPTAFDDDFDGVSPVPSDFFVPRTTDIEKVGEIQVTGDAYLLDEYFSTKN